MANTDENAWDVSAPANSDPSHPDGALEIRSLRAAVKKRIDREHASLTTGGAGGEHLEGSARCWYTSTTPTQDPGGSNLSANDTGRVWFHSGTNTIYVWNGSGFSAGNAVSDDSVTRAKLADHIFPHAKLWQQASSWSAGGGAFAGAGQWTDRILNQEDDSNLDVSLNTSTGVFTLNQAGTYRIRASAPAISCNGHQIRLYNVSTGSVVFWGTREHSKAGEASQMTRSWLEGEFDATAGQQFKIQHCASDPQGQTWDMGYVENTTVDFGSPTIYADVELIKYA